MANSSHRNKKIKSFEQNVKKNGARGIQKNYGTVTSDVICRHIMA